MSTDGILLSRWLFGATASFHIIFPCLIIGLTWYLTVTEALWIKTKQEKYRAQYQFWVKPFAAAFIVAVLTGVVLAFQLDNVFGEFYAKTVDVLVPIRKVEAASVMLLEGGCFVIMVWGWRKVGDRLHFAATLMMTLGVMISGVCILARNSWMQTPALAVGGEPLIMGGWEAALLSPSFPYRFTHMVSAALLSTALFALGISAWYLLKGRHQAFAQYGMRAAIAVLVLITPLQLISGHLHGQNTEQYQPAKLAAIEGLWHTTQGAPLVLFAIPDQEAEENRYELAIPKLGSLIVKHDISGEVKGLKAFPESDRPNAPIVFFAFRVMIGAFIVIAIITVAGAALWRTGFVNHRRFLKLCCAMSPAGFIATIAGWCVTEAGRQPWVIYQLVRTADVVSPSWNTSVAQSANLLFVAYAVIFLIFAWYLFAVIQKGPDDTVNLTN